jgi:hypothetical protein
MLTVAQSNNPRHPATSDRKLGLIKRVLKLQETASNVPNMTENHGVPGSTPGPATFYFLSISRKIAYWPSLARLSVLFSSPPRGVAAPITFPCLARHLFKLYLLRQSYTRYLTELNGSGCRA